MLQRDGAANAACRRNLLRAAAIDVNMEMPYRSDMAVDRGH
jgi:hypothetical protein